MGDWLGRKPPRKWVAWLFLILMFFSFVSLVDSIEFLVNVLTMGLEDTSVFALLVCLAMLSILMMSYVLTFSLNKVLAWAFRHGAMNVGKYGGVSD